jgi:hypothetical protein
MIAAPTLNQVLLRAELYGSTHPLRDRLVSVVFAEPASLVISDLNANCEFWDELTGVSWDLFFAGYYAYGSHGDTRPVQVDRQPWREGAWKFSPRGFREFLTDIERAMITDQNRRRAAEPEPRRRSIRRWTATRPGRRAQHSPTARQIPWRFSGSADLVSFMVYGGDPDWASLHAVELCGTTAPQPDQHPLGRAIEGLRRWQDEEPDPRFAPGETPDLGPFIPREALRRALIWSALAASSGIIGNRADDILNHLLH